MSSAGGGRDRVEAIANQIRQWVRVSDFEGRTDQAVDRIVADVFRNPDVFIDPELSASANWDIIKERLSLRTAGEIDELIADTDDMARQAVEEEVREQIREYGVSEVAEALADNPVPEDLRRRVADVLDEFPPDVYDAVIREELGVILDLLGGDLAVMDRDRIEDLQAEAERPGTTPDARRELLQELSRSFGEQFASIDEAVRALQERIAAARGERLRIAPIQARRVDDAVRVRIEDGSTFDPFEEEVRRRVRTDLVFPPGDPQVWSDVGEIRLRGGEFQAIDLSIGAEAYGAAADADIGAEPATAPPGEREQVPLEEATAPELARQFIDLAERDQGQGQGQDGESEA